MIYTLILVLSRYFNPAVKVDPEHIITGKLRNEWSSSAAADRKIYPISSYLNYSSHPLFDSNSPDRTRSTGVGVSAILDHLFHTILDAGDGVLILNPYYAGFDRDLVGGRSGVKLVGVDWAGYEDQIQGQDGDEDEDEWAGDAGLEEAFEKALQTARADGVDVSRRSRLRRFMPITDANLTLNLGGGPGGGGGGGGGAGGGGGGGGAGGITVSRSTLIGYCKFAQKHDLHLVSDEIYAMSVYENKSKSGLTVRGR
jgi:hypothetical protein